ncbi:MAG: hypothetical protein HC844_03790 [Tabrizicola sp.]|nr:hypothetical protein [Tabrizicola sp.]
MGFHDVPDRKTARPKAFRWPPLPELTPETARIEAHLFRKPGSVRAKIAGQIVTLTGPVRSAEPPRLAVDLGFGDKLLRVLVPEDAPGLLLGLHGITDDWQNYRHDTLALVVEHLLVEALAPLETVFGGPFRIRAVGPADDPAPASLLMLSVTVADGESRVFGLSGAAELLAAIAPMLSDRLQPDAGPDLAQLVFPMRLLGPSFSVTPDDLAAAKVGDGFFLERDWSALLQAELRVLDHMSAEVRHEGGFRLTQHFSPQISATMPKEAPMSDVTAPEAPAAATLPVTIRIELAETTATLAELQAMRPGSVLAFAEELPSTIRLLANDKPVARGDLVRIDGKIAVRLTEIL